MDVLIILTVVSIILKSSYALDTNSSVSAEKYYQQGIDAYLDERWEDCINDLESAIQVYKITLNTLSDCRFKCQHQHHEPLVKRDVEDLHYYEKMVRRTLCFIQCKRIRYPKVAIHYISDSSFTKSMEDLDSYAYLHICYYQKNLRQKAASAAFTYLVKHPDDKVMKSNFDFYLGLPEVDKQEITNYETEEYLPLYLHGMNAYNNEDWDSVIAYMDEAVHSYFASEQKCRALCEMPFDHGWYPDFTTSIANHFTFCLNCKRKCKDKLKMFNGVKGQEILADMYNYLQIAYFKMNRVAEAARAVASFLIINPSDKEMLHNKKIYSEFADPTMFVPYPDIVQYLLREEYEDKLSNFTHMSFTDELKLNKKETVVEDNISNDL